MRIHCERCNEEFERPLDSVGQIEFSAGCKSVFRVNYGLKTPCPKCLAILTVIPRDPVALGRLAEIKEEESTVVGLREAFSLITEVPEKTDIDGNTIPRTLEVTEVRDRAPAVHLREPEELKREVKAPESAFKLLQSMPAMPKPKHFSMRNSRKGVRSIPWVKFVFSFVIGTCGMLTLLLTFLALRDSENTAKNSSPAPTKIEQRQSPSKPASPKRLIPPQGGPEEESSSSIPSTGETQLASISTKGLEKEDWSLHVQRMENLTSEYGYRKDPFTKEKKFHGGIDIKARYRSEVQAALGGKVIFKGWKAGYGQAVILDHGKDLQTLYGHLSKPLVQEGQEVKKGSLLGLVGSTGRSTGPHLHFEVIKADQKINPTPYIGGIAEDTSDHVISDH